MQLPAVGTRVMVRYRLPAGSVPPLTDVVGHVVEVGPTLRVRTKRGEIVDVAGDDVIVIKELAAAPVRTADIRNLEHAAALAWPGLEQRWFDGWLLRAAGGHTHRGNSAVPLGIGVDASALPAIVDWYAERGLTPWLSIPDRLVRVDARPHLENVVMARDLASIEPRPDSAVALSTRPHDEWLRLYQRPVPVDVLTAVVDGELAFASIPKGGACRAALTQSPDGTPWLGLSALHVLEGARRHGLARALCTALLDWGADHGARRAYVQALTDNTAATRLFESLGFTVHHHSRYMRAADCQKGGGS
jgi:N-acetylglutamate synthase